jgi:hypothetical protein
MTTRRWSGAGSTSPRPCFWKSAPTALADPSLFQGSAGQAAAPENRARSFARNNAGKCGGSRGMSVRFEPIIGRYMPSRSVRAQPSHLCRGGRRGHATAMPAHRRRRRAAIPRADERQAHHLRSSRDCVRQAHRVRHGRPRAARNRLAKIGSGKFSLVNMFFFCSYGFPGYALFRRSRWTMRSSEN